MRNLPIQHRSHRKVPKKKVIKIGEWGICKRNPKFIPHESKMPSRKRGGELRPLELGNLQFTTVSRGA